MTKRIWIVGLCVALLSAVATPLVAQQERVGEGNETITSTDKRQKVVEMTPRELEQLINAIVVASEQSDVSTRESRDITIVDGKDRDLLLLLLQYYNLRALRQPYVQTINPSIQQPMSYGGQLYLPAGTETPGNNVIVVPQGGQGQSPAYIPTDDRAQRISALEDELRRLREDLASNPQPQAVDNSALERKIDDLRSEVSSLRQPQTVAPQTVPVQQPERVIYADRSRNNVQLSRSIFFKVNSDVINNVGADAVQSVANFVKNNPRALVLVYGYASIDGPVAFNNRLAAKRAASVIRALEDAGVPPVAIKRYDGGVDTNPAKRTDARRVDMDVIF